jgi:translation elongation factor EF-G
VKIYSITNKINGKQYIGRVYSPEARARMSVAQSGKTPWNKGKIGIYSKETLKRMSVSAKKRRENHLGD